MIFGQDWMSPRDARVSVAAGKAQIKHHGKWILLDPHTKGMPATLQWGMKLIKTEKHRYYQWKICLFNVLAKYNDFAWDEQEVMPPLVESEDSMETSKDSSVLSTPVDTSGAKLEGAH